MIGNTNNNINSVADVYRQMVIEKAKCWKGYERVPGTKAYAKGSCRPKGKRKKQKESFDDWAERQIEIILEKKKIKRVSYPGTKRGDSYCARSSGQMKMHPDAANDPDSMLRKRRKAWGCRGKKSVRKD